MQSKSRQWKINQIITTMPPTVPNHGLNTIHLAHMGVLGYLAQVYGQSTEGVASRHLIVLVTIRSE